MHPDVVIDLAQEALRVALVIGAPMLATGLVVGLVMGLLQAVTQIQEQTIAFVPKLVAIGVALCLTLPWLLQEMVQYSHDVITNIPRTL